MNEKELQEKEIVELAFQLLTGKIKEDDLDKHDTLIKDKVLILLDGNDHILSKKLDKRLIKQEIENSKDFDILEFLERPDHEFEYPYNCPYNIKNYKAAVGLIYDNNSFFCNVPINSTHAHVVTELHRLTEPDYEELNLYNLIHRNTTDGWQDKIMKEEHAIVIHLMPNDFGAAFFIPDNITSYQKKELERINRILLSKGILGEIFKSGQLLVEYLADLKRKEELFGMVIGKQEEKESKKHL